MRSNSEEIVRLERKVKELESENSSLKEVIKILTTAEESDGPLELR